MAFSQNGGGIGSRRQRGGSALSDINVTPFVDIVLVLLIIFMLTAHVMEFGLAVDVPKVKAGTETTQEMPVVSIPKDGTTYLDGKATNINDLKTAIRGKYGPKPKGVLIMADKATIWDIIAQVTAELGTQPGALPVNLVTKPMDTLPGRK